ncbi:hypothetical protein CF335_g7195 [Tilletia laevis]|nr:hypothetical protein CF335_g7195 [Tilletia laevis]
MTTEALRTALKTKAQDYYRLMIAVAVLEDGLEYLDLRNVQMDALLRSAEERLAEANAIIDDLDRTQIRLGPSRFHPGGLR